jgi:hypothetical protein
MTVDSDWLWRIATSLGEGKFVVRKIGPHWYITIPCVSEPLKVASQSMAIDVIDGSRRWFKTVGLIG